MFTLFAFIKRQVTAAIATIQKVLIAGNFTSFRAVNYNNIIKTTPTTAIDTTFNMGTGANSLIYASAIDENGKILIGGQFTTYSGSSQNYLTRINTNGTKDTSFNIGTTGFSNTVYDILPVSQSKVLIGGTFTSYSGSNAYRVVTLNSNGTIDTTFKNPGFNSSVYTFATQSDGKIIAGGDFTATGYFQQFISKRNSELNPDITFTGFNVGVPNSFVYAFASQSDGKILIGGIFTTYSGSTVNRIVRINTDGTRDTTFNVGTGFNLGEVDVIRVQPDNKILVGGSYTTYSGSAASRIVRINTDGTKDTSFNIGTGFNNGQVYDLQLQSDGKIIAVGSWTATYSGSSAVRIARINTSGSLDTTFNTGGGFSGIQYSAQIQNDGKIIVVGASATYSGSAAQRIRRINTNGTLDTTFNIGTAGLNNTTYRAKIQPDQKIVVLGAFTSYSGSAVNRITRINTDGTRDTTFNMGTGFNSVTAIPSALELDSSGSIYVGSNFATYSGSTANNFVKLFPSGSIITGSGLYNGFDSTVNAILVDSTGSVYTGGSFNLYLQPNNYIVRLNTDGTKDTSFQIGTGFNTSVYSLKVQPDDKIVVGGQFTNYSGSATGGNNAFLVRLNSNGTKDTSFNIGTAGIDNFVTNVTIQPDQKILVLGGFTSYSGSANNSLVRINSNGTKDTSFNIGTGFNTVTFIPSALEVDSSGNIHVGSNFASYSGSSVIGYVKLTSSGSIDPTFLSTAASASSTPGAYTQGISNTSARSISIDSSNNAYLFGNFQNYLVAGTGRIIALDTTQGNISIPPNFGTGFNASANLSTQDSSGNIWLAGFSTNYSGSSTTNSAVIKINPQGNLLASASNAYFLNLIITSLTAQSDQKILVGTTPLSLGDYNPVRYNSDGTFDNTFLTDYSYNGSIFSCKQQSTGDILIGGKFFSYYYDGVDWISADPTNLSRLNSNGTNISLDIQPTDTVYNINVLPDDSFIVTGAFLGFSNNSFTSSFYIGKLDNTGGINTLYNVGTGFNSIVYTSTLQPDGKLIAAGTFTSYSGSAINRTARINTDGTLDTTFNPGVGFNNFNSNSSKILVDQDSNIHVVGPFTTYSGSTVNGYVKLLPNGNIHPSYTGSFNSPIGVNSINFSPVSASTMELINV